MVRKSGIVAQRQAAPVATNGQANGLPPPSTIAAQIVHSRQDTGTKITFAELVKEFLQNPSTDEPDSQLIALVCVIAEAGLDGLFKDDPFASDTLKQQGTDSIAALKLILHQKPHLLLKAKDEENADSPRPPIIIWLYPKMLGLLSQNHLLPIHKDIRGFFSICLETLCSAPAFWRQAASLLQLYRSCVQSILANLEPTDDTFSSFASPFSLVLPSSSSINEFWPDSQQFVALPQELYKTITSRTQSIYVGFHLLSSIIDAANWMGGNSISSVVYEQDLLWSLDCCLALWRHFKRWGVGPDVRDFHDETMTMYMQTLEAVALSPAMGDHEPSSPKAMLSLANGLSDMIQDLPTLHFSQQNQTQLARILTRLRGGLNDVLTWDSIPGRRKGSLKTLIADQLEPTISEACQRATEFALVDRDLKLALCLWTSPGSWPPEVTDLRNEICSNPSNIFSDTQLLQESESVVKSFQQLNLVDEERPNKRQKTSSNDSDEDNGAVYTQIIMAINGSSEESPVLDLTNLHNIVLEKFSKMSDDVQLLEDEQSELILAFSKVACAGSRCLKSSRKQPHRWKNFACALCDASHLAKRENEVYWNNHDSGEDWKDVIAAMLSITREESFQKSSKPRVLMALAIGRLFNHISDPHYLNLDMCELGQWLLASVSRSLRELKIAAVRSLMVFLREDIIQNIRQKNRRSTVEFLNALSKRDILSDQEALIIAYGQIARVCGGLELPIILHQLVEYLGHTNPLICGMAYNELDSIADDFGTTPMELLRPFWKVIGFSVIKDILNKPQKAQQLADFTEQSVRQLLVLTHSDTLPHVVLTKRKDILERIASARGTEIEDLFLQPRKNLAKVLALLLCQPVSDVEANTMEILVAMAPAVLKLKEIGGKLENLVKMDPDKIAVEILVLAADHEEAKRKPFRRGFHTLAVLSETQHGHRKSASKAKSLDMFFEAHILGMIAHFSDIIESPLMQNQPEPLPLPERRRCVAAIEELISLARNNVSYALPQVRACLQSAMADPNLCDQTFGVWSALLMVLDKEDIEIVVDQTFALIVQHWSSFSDATQLGAHETVLRLTQKYNDVLLPRIDFIPSLASIPMMSKIEGEISRLKAKEDPIKLFHTFSQRCKDQNAVVVRQALKELVPFLETNQKHLHESVISQKPLPVLAVLCRSLLDACVRFAEGGLDIPILCAQCLGFIGGLDPYRVETVREKKYVLMLSNFNRKDEVIDFIALLLERILVKVFLSTNNAKAQGWIAYVMQEMLKACEFSAPTVQRPRMSQASPESQRWYEIPEAVRNTLVPFLSSRYSVTKVRDVNYTPPDYPIFNPQISHTTWLQTFVYDLLQKGKGVNVEIIFPVLSRVIRGYDLSIATFILPFAALNVIITGDDDHMVSVGRELLTVLETEIQSLDQPDAATIKQCSENVFQTLDYLSLWLQEKRKAFADAMVMAGKTGRGISEDERDQAIKQISCVENVLQLIPAEVISTRAVECGSYARALFHWEQYYRQEEERYAETGAYFAKDDMLQHLQVIYAQIDEPDSLEGISAHLQILNPDQQIMEHRKAGRWTAAQSWYEIALAEKPNDAEAQINLLTCLRESGQHDSILNYVEGFNASNLLSPSTLPFAVEAAWSVGKWGQLEKILSCSPEQHAGGFIDFNVGVGRALLELRRKDRSEFERIIQGLRETLAKGLSPTTTDSLQASHDYLVKLHALYELEAVSGMTTLIPPDREVILEDLERRLDILGAYTSDKQYLLGVRRAAMQLSRIEFTNLDIASAWLVTARLARKGDFMSTAFNSVLHATKLGDDASKIEYSRLLWKEGHHRKAIQNLQGAIGRNAFQTSDMVAVDISVTTTGAGKEQNNKVKCHAQLLLAKWLDRAGQTKHNTLKDAYATAVMTYPRWDKGHYYLGRYYLKLHESEKKLPVAKQTPTFLAGDTAKLVIENFVRSTVYGTKYYYQTLPKILTLWLDMGTEVHQSGARAHRDKELQDYKSNYLNHINKYLERYTNTRMPAFAWFTAFPQIITRISHPNKSVWSVLQTIIIQVASNYPQQALWSLLAVLHSTQGERSSRGTAVLQKLREVSKRKGGTDLKSLIVHGQRLTDALLSACDTPIEARVSHVSLSRNLGFNLKIAPCALVVPIEATMNPNLPSTNDSRAIRAHNPFPQDAVITISDFKDDVLVLTSLQRPRKLTVTGSDGRTYGLLCKPKDDLRKDQRLMEFNAMINRALQQDIEASKRRLYIKTYGVTPLNEECGTIEWVEGLKPMRDIIIRLYRQKNVQIDYNEIKMLLNEACSSPSKVGIFTSKILSRFPPVLHEWFIDTFPAPEAWFAARLRYTRSCAVMSIVGHVLGLGDRHGENVLLEEGNGGTFHVDFNCLFDKGLSFEKPELVPFRLTHNMVDAMGPQGIEGAFRTCCELTYMLLRQHEDTLITILETFVHDPTADFVSVGATGKRKKKIAGVPETPQEVLDNVKTKVAGYMKGESVPLSVEGYVDALCQMAVDPMNLAAMYIGWCAFF